MLVSSIGYLNSNKNFGPLPVKNKNSKKNSGFGHVQNIDGAVTYKKNPIMTIVDSMVSFFTKNRSNDKNLSLMA